MFRATVKKQTHGAGGALWAASLHDDLDLARPRLKVSSCRDPETPRPASCSDQRRTGGPAPGQDHRFKQKNMKAVHSVKLNILKIWKVNIVLFTHKSTRFIKKKQKAVYIALTHENILAPTNVRKCARWPSKEVDQMQKSSVFQAPVL